MAAVLIGITAYVGAAVVDDDGEPRQESQDTTVDVGTGERAPAFDLPTLDGERVRLSDFRGRPVLLNFWASWCHPCRQEFPILAEVLAEHKGDGLAVIGITFRDIEADSRGFANEFGATWPLAVDDGGAVARAFGVRAIPVTFFVHADGTITARIFGFSSADALEEPLTELLR